MGLGGASEAGPGYFHTMQFLNSYLIRAKEKVQTYRILQTEFLLYRHICTFTVGSGSLARAPVTGLHGFAATVMWFLLVLLEEAFVLV